MESELTKVDSSIPVPMVQEVAKEALGRVIPQRYQRPDQDPPFASNFDTLSPPQVPVIDMLRLLSEDSMNVELQNLHHSCKQWGFFQLVNLGVSSSLVDKVKKGTAAFFKLPMEEEMKLWQRPEEVEGFGQLFVVSEEQKLDWGDMFLMTAFPTHLRKPHLFSNLPLPIFWFQR